MSLSNIKLRYYTDDEIRALAVVKVTHAGTYDRGVPKLEGLNDPRLGLVDHTIRCPTCFKSNCDQHYGYIELAKPVYRLGVINLMLMILRCVCRECAKPKFTFADSDTSSVSSSAGHGGQSGTGQNTSGVIVPLASQNSKNTKEKLRIISDLCRNKMTCNWCGAPQPNYSRRARAFIDATYRPKELASEFVKARGPKYLKFLKTRFMPDDAAAILMGLDALTKEQLDLDRPETLVMHLQLVPPPNIRPSNFVGETKVRSENDLTCALQDIVRTNTEFQDFLANGSEKTNYEGLYDKLQVMVSGLVNNAIKRSAAQSGILPMITATSKRKIIDLRTRLNGKKARVRGNLNGKRVDQSARTVISGDSSYDIDVLGVPSVIMNKLTFPEPVTDQNLSLMARCVVLGAYVNGGALAVKPPNHATDTVFWLPILDHEGRIDLAAQLRPGWIVERHLVEHDWILFNRQPTLWKASMMAFRCKRVEGLTIRVPLVVTRAFNADFDGDEMNLHSLQGYEAIAEAQELMRVNNQIITPQSGTVVIGLVQDALVGAWRLTAHDSFFSFEQALDLLMAINYAVPGKSAGGNSSTKTCGGSMAYQKNVDSSTEMKSFFDVCQPAIWVRQTSSQTKSSGTTIKPIWTGKQLASMLLPSSLHIANDTKDLKDLKDLQENTAAGLHIKHGHILSGRLSKASLGASNRGIIQGIWRLYGPGGAHKFISDAQRLFVKHLGHDGPTQSILDCLVADDAKTVALLSRDLGRSDSILSLNLPKEIKEAKSVSILQETLRAVGSCVLAQVRPDCALADCVNSGSKGNVMNIAQISGCVGQQTIYGKRVPVRQTRLGPRTLVYYAPGDLRAEARGFISNSYIRGLSPIETFQHQMAGREGIVATAVNTSETGYNQRRMIKGQESQKVGYDGMVRVSDNHIVQTAYGSDDLDGSRLERIRFHFLLDSSKLETLVAPLVAEERQLVQRCLALAKQHMAWNANLYKDLDPTFPCAINLRAILASFDLGLAGPSQVMDFYRGLLQVHSRHHAAKKALMNHSIFSAVLQAAEMRTDLARCSTQQIRQILDMYAGSLISPGEGVGALGASSIGEPSMQKTLNTFHYAGIADKNVTITGLPRFKQLINGVDTYETANMTAALRSFEDTRSALQISRVMLHEVLLNDIAISESKDKRLMAYFDLMTQKGPFYAKFGLDDTNLASSASSASSTRALSVLTLHISWTLCARKHLTLDTISRSLRALFSFDACIITRPHWSQEKFSVIDIVLAPWLTGAKAITDALKMQHQVRGLDYIKNAITFQETRYTPECSKVSGHVVETEGSNVVHLAACSFIDPQTIRTNNVLEAFSMFGISTGTMVLQSELHLVLSFDGSYIDPRHTWLLADTMGRNGTLAAMNRHHMLDLGSSLLQEASFERSLEVFEEGAAHGRSDALVGATERIIVGQPVGIGTGIVEIVYTQATPAQDAQVMITSLDDVRVVDDVDVDTIIDPMVKRTNCADEFAKAFTEYDKVTADPFFLTAVVAFRTSAAERRLLPCLTFKKALSLSKYRGLLKDLWASSWTSQKSIPLETEVHWLYKDKDTGYGLTLNEHTPGDLKSYRLETFFNDSRHHQHEASQDQVKDLECTIYSKTFLQPIDVPFGVQTSRITMRQVFRFTKGPTTLSIGREWTANTNVDCEQLMLTKPGQCFACLDITDPESILQNRCSDVQLANALKKRIS